jgi:hypothetical protein
MSVHLVLNYWPAVIGLVVGAGAGGLLATLRRGSPGAWDRRVTVPLLLAASAAHLALIPTVETERQILFALYGASLVGVVVFATLGMSIWRLGAVVFPLGSIGAYVYFALLVHQADYIGLLVKLVEVAALVAAFTPVVVRTRGVSARPSLT